MDERVAVVTGGGTGIGAATAHELAARGMHLALVGRRKDKLEDVAREIELGGGMVCTIQADLAESHAPADVVEAVLDRFGQIDVVINNAATIAAKPFDQFTLAEFDEHIAVNIRSVFFLIQAALPPLRRSPMPVIVNVSSEAGARVNVGNSLYSMTKAALDYLTQCLAAELAGDGIRVNAIAPGPTDTPIHATYSDDVESAHRQLRAMIPLGRLGTADEVAWWIGHLVDPQASWVTGAVIRVDGGTVLGTGCVSTH